MGSSGQIKLQFFFPNWPFEPKPDEGGLEENSASRSNRAKGIQLKCKTLRCDLAPRQAVAGTLRTGPQHAFEYSMGATP